MKHDCEAEVKSFAEKLGARARHVVFLLGAGASCAANLPSFHELKEAVGERLDPKWREAYERLAKNRNLEDILTQVRLVAEVLRDSSGEIDGLSAETAVALDTAICTSIARTITESAANIEHHERFARWVTTTQYSRPIEIFTTNYDLLIEKGLEAAGAPYFDGFIGTYSGRFRTDLVDEELADEGLRLPSRWARVWKLHGSISWAIQTIPDHPAILRIGRESIGETEIPLAIYPSLKKYQESRREPFVTLADRLRRSLALPETLVVTCGYSFGDQHINEVLYDAARYYPRSEVIATFYDSVPTGVVAEAKRLPNLSALGPLSAVIGSREAEWEFGDSKLEFTEGAKYRLGDFARLASFLARGRTGSGSPQPVSAG